MAPSRDKDNNRYFTRNRLSRGQGLRKATGCLTCRRRHVKCDEIKPKCGNCERLKHECNYPTTYTPPRRSAKSQPREDADTEKAIDPSKELVNDESQQEPKWPDDTLHKTYDTAAPDSLIEEIAPSVEPQPESTTAHSVPISIATPLDWGIAAPSTASGLNVDSATTLWAELLLQDAAFQNSNFEDNYDVVGTDIFANTGSRLSLTEQSPSGFLLPYQPYKEAWQSSMTLELAADEHQLFQNFIHNLSRWMDFFDPLRPFGTLVPRLALRNVGLLNAILALSVRHLSLNLRFQRADEEVQSPLDALPYYFKTLHYIQEAMQFDSYKNSQELLATASIVSAYEMLDGSRQDWERHLKGLFCIQRSQTIHGDSGGLKGAVWWAWLCQDVWAAFRKGRKPLTFWRPDRVLSLLAPHELAARSIYLFAQAVGFCSKEEIINGQANPLARITQADALRSQLMEWKAQLGAEFEAIPQDTIAHGAFEPIWVYPPSHAVALQMYYCSHILLLLHRPALGGLEVYNAQRRDLVDCTNKICGIAMTTNDDPSSVMCSQALYIAGMTLESPEQRQVVVDLLESCWQRAGWPMRSLGEDLKLRWNAGATVM